jgi:hypothetical protein
MSEKCGEWGFLGGIGRNFVLLKSKKFSSEMVNLNKP